MINIIETLLMLLALTSFTISAGYFGYVVADLGTRDMVSDAKKRCFRKLFQAVFTLSCAGSGAFVGYVIGLRLISR